MLVGQALAAAVEGVCAGAGAIGLYSAVGAAITYYGFEPSKMIGRLVADTLSPEAFAFVEPALQRDAHLPEDGARLLAPAPVSLQPGLQVLVHGVDRVVLDVVVLLELDLVQPVDRRRARECFQ